MEQLPGQRYSNWVEIDLGAIENNIKAINARSGVQVMAVVKANAYGHGAIPVAKTAVKAGATWLGVARLEEALELRRAGLIQPILLLGFVPSNRIAEAVSNQLSLTVWDREQVEQAAAAARQSGTPARIHLKVDTGMSRLGVKPEEAIDFANGIAAEGESTLIFEGVFTHFARADEPDCATTELQEAEFLGILEGLKMRGICPQIIHAFNSAAGMTRPSGFFNLVRAGIAIYGLQPSTEFALPPSFRPALSWKATLSQVRVVPAGQGVSYGHAYTAIKDELIGTVPVGYADGFRRAIGNLVIAGGRQTAVVGRVCMDQAMIQLDPVPGAKKGDEIVLIGTQGETSITAEEVAQRWGTINYEVVCGIGSRVPRIYL